MLTLDNTTASAPVLSYAFDTSSELICDRGGSYISACQDECNA